MVTTCTNINRTGLWKIQANALARVYLWGHDRTERPAAPVRFFFTHPATTEIYTLSLHDALPISPLDPGLDLVPLTRELGPHRLDAGGLLRDRKSTRLNSSHVEISYAVFCLK